MDPQSLSFIPSGDVWRLTTSMRNFQEVQQEHADRLLRLERRQEDDARMKSVWGSASPFPGVLSGTPQHGPVTQSSGVEFVNFDDDQSNSMVRSLHLDVDDEPRRFGVGSRANSVRFDESASKQGQWAHTSRSSVDLPRTASGLGGLGGLPMFERTVSHKSDGRQSSAGQSAVSGRANSLMLDSSNRLSASSSEVPSLSPGLFILGSVPSIIRCWLDQNFKHDSLLYAAVCTGSYKSYLDARLVNKLGLAGQVLQDLSGARTIRVPVYLPEAIPQPASSRSSSPAPQLPSLTVDFTVLDRGQEELASKAIQIFIGSDILRAHNADVLFSSNTMTLFDDDKSKLSIPFVRPESDDSFKSLITTAGLPIRNTRANFVFESKSESPSLTNGASLNLQGKQAQTSVSDNVSKPERVDSPSLGTIEGSEDTFDDLSANNKMDRDSSPAPIAPPKLDTKLAIEDTSTPTPPSRTSSSPAVWGNWRREGGPVPADWASASKGNSSSTYQRNSRDQGIKVLKPTTRQPSRSGAPNSLVPASPTSGGQSRFFDDGKRRVSGLAGTLDTGESSPSQHAKRSVSGENPKPPSQLKDASTPTSAATPIGTKPRSTNPIGGASAFNWLNSGAQR